MYFLIGWHCKNLIHWHHKKIILYWRNFKFWRVTIYVIALIKFFTRKMTCNLAFHKFLISLIVSWLDCADIDMISEKLKHSDGLGIVDIDSVKLKDPQVWSSYAPDIYNNIRVREVSIVDMSFYIWIVSPSLLVTL